MLLCFLVLCWLSAASAAVIPNTTTSIGSTTTVVVTTTTAAPRVALALTTSSTTSDGSWTYDFAQFISYPATDTNSPGPTPHPTTPISHLYPEMYPIFALSRLPEKPFIGLASPYANSYAVQHGHTDADTDLRASCSTAFDASLNPFLLTAPIAISTTYPQSTDVYTSIGFTGETWSYSSIPTTVIDGTSSWKVYSAVPTTITQAAQVITDTYDSWTLWTYPTPFTYSASGECCWTCTIVGGTHVQVNYWPKTEDSKPVASIVDDKGFTFVSPSVYVAFETLYATNLCGGVGPTFKATTLAFGATELSTATAYRWDTSAYAVDPPLVYQGQWTQADWGDQASCASTEKDFYQYKTFATFDNLAELSSEFGGSTTTLNPTDVHHYTITWNNCSPSLSVPTEILDIDTAWKDCSQGLEGIYDPPYPLKPQGALIPTTTTVVPVNTPTNTPTQSPTAIPPTPTPTPAPTPSPEPVETPTPDPSPEPVETPTTSPVPQGPSTTSKSGNPVQSPKPVDPKPEDPKPQDPNTSTNPGVPVQTPKPSPPADPADPAHSPNPADPAQSPDPQDPSQNTPPTARPTTAAGVITIGSSIIIADPSSAFVIGTNTLVPGSQVTASGQIISLATDGASVVIDGSTLAVTSAPIVRPSGFVVGSQTLEAGGPAITIDGTKVSLDSNAVTAVVDGTSIPVTKYLSGSTTIAENLASIIASVGDFGTPGRPESPAKTSAQAVGSGTYNGTVFTGGAAPSKGPGSFLRSIAVMAIVFMSLA